MSGFKKDTRFLCKYYIMNKKDLNLLSEAYQKISQQLNEYQNDWVEFDNSQDPRDVTFYDKIQDLLRSYISEINKQIQEEASKGILKPREVDQFLKELHNILSLDIESARAKLKDVTVKNNRG